MSNAVGVIAAHPDDEVLGCGGTVARMASEGRAVHILLMADGETARVSGAGQTIDPGRLAARNAAAEAASEILSCASVEVLTLPDNRLHRLELSGRCNRDGRLGYLKNVCHGLQILLGNRCRGYTPRGPTRKNQNV